MIRWRASNRDFSYTCTVCGQIISSSDRGVVEAHRNECHLEPESPEMFVYKCADCPYSYRSSTAEDTKQAKRRHIELHHEQETASDAVNHPAHYNDGKANGWETIEVIKNELSSSEFQGFLKGQVFKYLSRAGKKESALVDAQKAAWYCDRLIQELKSDE